MEHGTANGYSYYRCRCDDCTEAWRVRSAEQRAYWGDPKNYVSSKKWHGTKSGYGNYGCRCTECIEAARAKERE